MIEKTPQISKKELNKALTIILSNECNEKIGEINEKYSYWDKVKYQANDLSCTPKELWAAVKIRRKVNYKSVKFGKYSFHYVFTNIIQEYLHTFDLNVGGSLSGKQIEGNANKE
ncbi:MAG: hypothetical protein ACK5MI_04380 [Mangrovibacterium sp.]